MRDQVANNCLSDPKRKKKGGGVTRTRAGPKKRGDLGFSGFELVGR